MPVCRHWLPVILCLLLGACSSALNWAPETHVVQAGETVYEISFRYRIDQADLIAWNRLGSGGLIFVGQKLRLTPPPGYTPSRSGTSAPTSASRSGSTSGRSSGSPGTVSAVRWQWPTEGSVIAGYGATAKTQSGVQISGRMRQPIEAAAAGEVVYVGSGLPGYGQLLIIKHSDAYLSAYGHNDRLVVSEGDRVTAGQVVARMGEGPGQRPMLHFEIRKWGKPVNPLGYLPKR